MQFLQDLPYPDVPVHVEWDGSPIAVELQVRPNDNNIQSWLAPCAYNRLVLDGILRVRLISTRAWGAAQWYQSIQVYCFNFCKRGKNHLTQ